MIIIWDLYLLSQLELKSDGTNFFVQQFSSAGHLSLVYEIPTRHKSTTSN